MWIRHVTLLHDGSLEINVHNSFKFHKNEEKKYNIFTVSFIWSEMLFPKGQFKIFPAPYLHSFIVQTDPLKPVLVDCKQTSSHYWCTVRGPGMGPGTTEIKLVKNSTFRAITFFFFKSTHLIFSLIWAQSNSIFQLKTPVRSWWTNLTEIISFLLFFWI